MSGGGSGGGSREQWRSGEADGGIDEDICDLSELTILSSPDPEVVRILTMDDILTVELIEQTPQRLVAKTDNNIVAGTITSKEMPTIAACIRHGFEYEAVVLSVDGGRVEVLVKRR